MNHDNRVPAVAGSFLLGLLWLIGSVTVTRAAPAAAPPNIVIILADDLGYGDLSCQGHPVVRTPHLDQLAAEGTRFTSFYSQPVCGPARSALLTGRYPSRSKGWGMPAAEITFAELLQDAGYATVCIGKWDVSNRKPIRNRMPLAQGFDQYWGPLGANDAGHVVLYENNKRVGVDKDLASLSRRYTDRAIAWLRQHIGEGRKVNAGSAAAKTGRQPFLLYLCHTMMHTVIDASPPFRDRTGNGLYADTLEELDHECGRLFRTIDELGIGRETLVIFTSDNGAWSNDAPRQNPKNAAVVPWTTGEQTAVGSNAPLREGKGSDYEGGVRVPCLVRWPGTVPAGQVNDAIFATLDFLPTFASLCGFEPPADRIVDGVDQTRLLLGDSAAGSRRTYFYHSGTHGVRKGNWKLLRANRWSEQVRRRRTYPKDFGSDEVELYDLKADVGETHNVAAEHPDVVAELLALRPEPEAPARPAASQNSVNTNPAPRQATGAADRPPRSRRPGKLSGSTAGRPAADRARGSDSPTGGPADRPPNFVIINVDDLGFADVEPFSDRFETPNLRQMAAEGRTFSSFYVASSVCTPSRAALLTGCYPARIDMLHNDLEMDTPNHGVLWPGDRKGLRPDEITIAEVLKERGYATACIGKWHLGDQPAFLPTRQGFDRFFGIPFSNDMALREPFPRPLPLVRDERVCEELAPAKAGGQDLLTRRYTEEALRFLDEVNTSRKPGTKNLGPQPFFLYLPHSMVHGPLAVSSAFRGSTGKGLYADAVAEVDWSVGRILAKLRDLGVAENTLVIFTSDNGGAYRPKRPNGSSNAPFSGGKGTPAEGGFRVPTIAWWPGTIPAGTSTDLLAATVDLLPTFAALSGTPHQPQPDRPIDGLDLSGLFQGPLPGQSPRESFVYYTDNTEPGRPRQPRVVTAVRQGPWKLYLRPARFPLTGGPQAGIAAIEPGALFQVIDDCGETADVSGSHPAEVEQLRRFAAEVIAELGDTVAAGAGFRPAGFLPPGEAVPLNDRTQAARNRAQPDVLFIAIDDMNDWTTLFDPANPIRTPQLERLAARGSFFTRAYCAAPACNPSRTAIMTGLRPTTSGVYENRDAWRRALPDAVTLPQHFARHGYATRGGGKILHHGPSGREPADNRSFQEFFERIPYPRPKIRSGAFGCFDWGPLAADQMADTPLIEWAERELGREHDAPLFLAAGIFMPHLPHFAPPEILAEYPLERTTLPPLPPDDLDDIPPPGIELTRREWKLWRGYLFDNPPPEDDPASLKNLVRCYQAAATYADDLVGRLLDRLDETGRADHTIIVLWSDHGYHLGDKQSTVKFTLWEKATHVPLVIVAPGVTEPGSRIDTPVSLVDIYATMAELAGLPARPGLDSRSLVPLLKNPAAEPPAAAVMTMGRGNHALRTDRWRYIRYADGSEELYDCETDGIWNHDNLLVGPEAETHRAIADQLREALPKTAN